MQQTFEIELRGPLTKEQYDSLIKKFSEQGEFVQDKNRVLIDYSTMIPDQGIEGRNKDIRLRVTNKKPEIIVKLGAWGGNEQREELSILTEEGTFDTLVKVYNALGYSKGVLCERNSKVYNYNGVEFALVEVPNHSYFFEAEKVVTTEGEKDQAQKDIEKVCMDLDLSIYTDQEFYDYVEQLNKEANEVFDFENDFTEGYFKHKFDL